MIDSLFNLVFRCRHCSMSRPMTASGRTRPHHGQTYVVCLDCGRHFSYDWDTMQVGKPLEDETGRPALSQRKSWFRSVLAAIPPAGWLAARTARSRKSPSDVVE